MFALEPCHKPIVVFNLLVITVAMLVDASDQLTIVLAAPPCRWLRLLSPSTQVISRMP